MLDPYSNIYYCMDCLQENSPTKIVDNLILIPVIKGAREPTNNMP